MAEIAENEELSPDAFASIVMERLGSDAPQRFAEGPAEEVVEDGITDAATPEETESTDQPRDEKGRYAKTETEGEEPEETVEEITEEQAEYLFAGKYKTADDLERAYTEAEKRLGEMRNELGTGRGEIAELREALEQRLEAMQSQLSQNAQVPITQQMVDDDPAGTAALAVKQGNYEALVAAVDSWKDEEPFEAAVFWANLNNEYRLDQMREAQAAAAIPVTPAAPAAQNDDAVNAEVAKVQQRNPDIETFLPQIAEVAKERPALRALLELGSPKERAEALEDLYVLAKSRHTAATSSDATREAALRAAQEGREARAEASVISASRGSAASEEPSGVDLFKQAFRQHTGLPLDDVE